MSNISYMSILEYIKCRYIFKIEDTKTQIWKNVVETKYNFTNQFIYFIFSS